MYALLLPVEISYMFNIKTGYVYASSGSLSTGIFWGRFLLFSVCGTTSENLEDFVICLKNEVVSVLVNYCQTSHKRPLKMRRCNDRVVHSENTEIRSCIKWSFTRDRKPFEKL